MTKLTHEELISRQEKLREVPKLPFRVILNNIRSLQNVGSIFRTCDGLGVEKIWLCGITGCPPDNKISKTALGAEKEIPWEFSKTVEEAIKKNKAEGYRVVSLEQTTDSIPYQESRFQDPVCLVLGNEVEGVSEEIISLSDEVLEIEMMGLKNSLNVAVAFGVAGYHIRNQLVLAEKVK